jgi:PAS domain S-box-containing protein
VLGRGLPPGGISHYEWKPMTADIINGVHSPADAPALGFLSSDLLLAAIVDSSDDAIVSKNLDGTITSWNRGAERIFGYPAQEMIGQPILRLIPPDRLQEEPEIISRIRRGERVDHFETVRIRKDGTLVDVSLTISPVKNEIGIIVGASKIARDISDQKRALEKLAEANEALTRADRLKADFISTLSHELRTPLTAIAGWIDILRDGATPEELAQGLTVIERNVRAQSQLIDDLLDMSRIESGKLILDIQRLDLPPVLTAAIDSVRPTAQAKGVQLTSTFSSIGLAVMADRNRLQQIVWNLLINAIKFTPAGGHVHVDLRKVHSHVEISVTDTGAGIPLNFLNHIFERFSQADASSTRRHGGLGLGLAIVKHLVELHGGSVQARSQGKDLGATFIVSLPLIPLHQAPDRGLGDGRNASLDAQFEQPDLRGISVLSVDDEPDSAEVVRLILQRGGASVRTVRSMDEALAAFADFRPDVVLTDIGMPDHDGYEFINRLRALPGGRAVPAVALTALARSEDRTRALRAGFQMHVAKPVEATELVAVVRSLANLPR